MDMGREYETHRRDHILGLLSIPELGPEPQAEGLELQMTMLTS